MARFTVEPIPPELLSTRSMAGQLLQEHRSAFGRRRWLLLVDGFDFSERLFDALSWRVRFPTKCVAAEAWGELPFVGCGHVSERAFEIYLLTDMAACLTRLKLTWTAAMRA